jgi:REP element-mobilizing transposase RayT
MLQGITIRLQDSLPAKVLARWRQELASLPDSKFKVQLDRRVAAYLDAGHGACWLRDERIARLVEAVLLHFDGQRYRLLAWCVMPNHVHALIDTFLGHTLADILHSWKSYSASEANKILNRTGSFWFREYHDRYIRNAEHFVNAIRYIEENPVAAGLVRQAKDWPFGSARLK